MNACVTGCMLTQHQAEIEYIKEHDIGSQIDKIMGALPPKMQEMQSVKK